MLDRIPNAEGEDLYSLTRHNDADESIPLDLFGTQLGLFVLQTLRIVDAEDGPGTLGTGKHVETLNYRYRLQDGEASLIRWEYDRERTREGDNYPLAHVHLHGRWEQSDLETERLHIPTQRVPLEMVLWFLLSEDRFGITSKDPDWETILTESIEGFRERRTTRD